MKLQGKRIAILAENMYQEMELWVPYYRFKEEGAEVRVVGAGGAKSYTSKHGYPVSVDVQADQVKAVEFDAVGSPRKTFKVFTREEGGEQHCQVDNVSIGVACMWDWLEEVFRG